MPTDDQTKIVKKPPTALVIGDAMVDAYLKVESAGISDEAPVIVADWIDMKRELGGMLNTAASLVTLGLSVRTISLIGDDESGQWMQQETKQTGIEATWLTVPNRPTIEKTRVISEQNDYLARLDHEQADHIPHENTYHHDLQKLIQQHLAECHVVVVSDYAKGCINQATAEMLIQSAKQANVPVLVDARPVHMPWYKGADLFTPNEAEAKKCAKQIGMDRRDYSLDEIGRHLCQSLNSPILITRGPNGMTYYAAPDTEPVEIPCATSSVPHEVQVRSTSGAGDVVMAVMADGAARGENPTDTAVRANQLVAQTLKRDGTCRLEPGDLP